MKMNILWLRLLTRYYLRKCYYWCPRNIRVLFLKNGSWSGGWRNKTYVPTKERMKWTQILFWAWHDEITSCVGTGRTSKLGDRESLKGWLGKDLTGWEEQSQSSRSRLMSWKKSQREEGETSVQESKNRVTLGKISQEWIVSKNGSEARLETGQSQTFWNE